MDVWLWVCEQKRFIQAQNSDQECNKLIITFIMTVTTNVHVQRWLVLIACGYCKTSTFLKKHVWHNDTERAIQEEATRNWCRDTERAIQEEALWQGIGVEIQRGQYTKRRCDKELV